MRLCFLFNVAQLITEGLFFKGTVELHLVKYNKYGDKLPVPTTIEAIAGSNLTLICEVQNDVKLSEPQLVWGRRTKDFWFKNEIDLQQKTNEHIYDLLKENEPYHITKATKSFMPLKFTDRGVHFCMSLKYMKFLIVHIKVRERKSDYLDQSITNDVSASKCNTDRFRCVTSGHCINLHYKCDGKADCYDGSDEDSDLCNGDPCKGKILCRDGRCIPTTWCCNERTEDNCTVAAAARPSCCPPLPNPFDPINFYNDQNKIKEMHKSNGSRYLFITICVISAVLSFVLFLFIISKICGFDSKPTNRSRNANTRNQTTTFADSDRCEHSECAIRREFNPNMSCLYRTAIQSSDNNNEVADPLISITTISARTEMSDQPPPYSEVVTSPPSIDKCFLDDLINAPPPPYSSTKFFSETERGSGNDLLRASNCANDAVNNYSNNQSAPCDIGTAGDRNNE